MLHNFIKAIVAGLCISIGGVVYLSLESHIAGAFLFSIGLVTIYTFDLNLFTGKVCYLPEKGLRYLPEVAAVLAGNTLSTVGMGTLLRTTRLAKLVPYTQDMVSAKLSDTLGSTLIVAVLCGFLMSIAVLGYHKIKDGTGRYLVLILPVMVFILAGFEHSIADLFYYSFAGAWGAKALLYIILIILGNLAGGLILPLCGRVCNTKEG